jgi:hypothetical protein
MDRLLRSPVSFETAIDQCLQVLGFRHKGYGLDVFMVKGLPASKRSLQFQLDKCSRFHVNFSFGCNFEPCLSGLL